MNNVTIIGAGLAGCESALLLSSHGFNVKLYDSKPEKLLPVYNLESYAELVCNSSMGKASNSTPLGLLLYELKLFGSKLVCIAESCRVKDKFFFAVDKKKFSRAVTDALISTGVTIYNKHMQDIPQDDVVIIATGPLTDEVLISKLSRLCNIKEYHFFDASSPIININTVDLRNKDIKKVTDDLYCVLLSEQVVKEFCRELANTEYVIHNNIDDNLDYEKCQSIEKLAKMGIEKLVNARFINEYSNQPSLLLRRENGFENGFILVGCMTTLPHIDQRRIFSMLPGFNNIRFEKYGRMHRNTFVHSPGLLNSFYQVSDSNLYIVGQLSGGKPP